MSSELDKIIKNSAGEENYFHSASAKKWLAKQEAELMVDVYAKDDNIIVKATVAGAKPEDIDVSINNDILTIRGVRHFEDEISEKNYLHRECFWGNFSRSIILPTEIQKGRIKAILKNGVLTLVLPKANIEKKIKIKEVDE